MNKSFLDLASDPHQYDSVDIDWNKEGNTDSPTRMFYRYYLLPELDVKGKNVLDIGCGFGWLFPSLVEKGAKEVVGIEPSQKSVAFARERYPSHNIIQSTLEGYRAERKFDVCVAVLVFEHLRDLKASLKQTRDLLVGDGKFFLITIDYDYAMTSRFNYKMDVEKVDPVTSVTKTTRDWGMVYDICRMPSAFIEAGMEVGFKEAKDIPISPNMDTIQFVPRYRDLIGKNVAHLLVFSK